MLLNLVETVSKSKEWVGRVEWSAEDTHITIKKDIQKGHLFLYLDETSE